MANLEKIVDELSTLTVMEAADLAKLLEDKWGVSAPIAAPKIAVQFAKANENLVILGGAMGAIMLDLGAVKSLAALPSLDELRGTLVGLLQAPAGQIARVVSAPGGQLARVVGAYSTKDAA